MAFHQSIVVSTRHILKHVHRYLLRQSWWCHQVETFSALLALCVGNSPVTNEFSLQRPVTRSFDVFFDLRLNKRLRKQSIRRWLETPWHWLWRHCNDAGMMILIWYSKQKCVTVYQNRDVVGPILSGSIRNQLGWYRIDPAKIGRVYRVPNTGPWVYCSRLHSNSKC